MGSTSKVQKVVDTLISSGAWRACLIVSPREVVRATRRWYRGRRSPEKRRIETLVTIGPPNYRERDLIKACQKAGEQFPVRKIQLQFKRA